MDAKRTGAFIAQLRKAQNLTQKELAERLSVSDKAISRWETGKGFPDTGLLKPLADVLQISVGELLAGERIPEPQLKAHTDQVIVDSIHSAEKRTGLWRLAALLAVGILVLLGVVFLLLNPPPENALAFVRRNIPMRYTLLQDNEGDKLLYEDLLLRTFDGGYEYYTSDGTLRYVFTCHPQSPDIPVMTYMHCSAKDGSLLGIPIGGSTTVKQNETLGIEKDYSLRQFLKDLGFAWRYEEFQFGRRSLVYIDGERCNWYFYHKDGVFINLLISAVNGKLYGYDVGLMDTAVETALQKYIHGCYLQIADPDDILKGAPEVYLPGEAVTLYARKSAAEGGVPRLYLDGKPAGTFTPRDDFYWTYEITFAMPAQSTAACVRWE